MRQSRSLFILSLASGMSGVQAVPPGLPPVPSSAIVALGPDGSTCEAAPMVTVQPFYYSSYFAGPATIYNFNGNGDDITINNGDTTFITQGYITVTSTVTVPVSSPASSGTVGPILISTTNSAGQVSSTTTAAAQTALRLGQGLPSGLVTSLDQPIILGYAYTAPNTPATQVNAVGYEQREGLAGTTGLDCSYATRFYLQNGRLVSVYAGQSIGRNSTAEYAMITPWPYSNDITTTFYFLNGILGWNTTDRGPGVFYMCGGPLYAAFPLLPLSNCSLVVIGGILESACPADATKPQLTTSSLSTPTLPTTLPTSILGTTQLSFTTTSVSLSTVTTTTIQSSSLVSVPSSLLSSTPSIATGLSTSLPNLSTTGVSTSLQTSLPATSSTSLSISLSSLPSTSLLTSVPTSIQTSLPISLPSSLPTTLPTTAPISLPTMPPSTSKSVTVTTSQITTTSVMTTTPMTSPTGAVSYCPQYNNTQVTYGNAPYAILCDYKLVGKDILPFFPPGYSAQNVTDLTSCMNICNVWNMMNGDGYCVGVTYDETHNACYPYAFFQGDPVYAPGYDAARRVFALTSSTTTQGISIPPISIPTSLPISLPTSLPISIPPISIPTSLPISIPPISIPTSLPISIPTSLPISIPPISIPTSLPISIPTSLPISIPTSLPISIPPISIPTSLPISIPTSLPISIPTSLPISIPTSLPISIPTSLPISIPTSLPISIPTSLPISIPTSLPISIPTSLPISIPTSLPVSIPTSLPVSVPTSLPVSIPTSLPISVPTSLPVSVPTSLPVSVPTSLPVSVPTSIPVSVPTSLPVSIPGGLPIGGGGGNPTTTTSIPVVIPTTTSIPVVIPTTTSIPVVIPTTTSIPVVIPTTTSIPVVIPTTTSIPVVITTITIPGGGGLPIGGGGGNPTTTTITTTAAAVTTAGPGPGVCILPVYSGFTVAGSAPPLSAAADFCPAYDMSIVSDPTYLNYDYEIYCDAEIGGTDLFLPPGFTESTDTFAECLDACNYWNYQSACIVCEAVVFIGPGACYPKTDIYIQPPIGQFNYYFQGRIAAQVMDTRYPLPTATKETCGKFGCTTTTPAPTGAPLSTSTILSIGISI